MQYRTWIVAMVALLLAIASMPAAAQQADDTEQKEKDKTQAEMEQTRRGRDGPSSDPREKAINELVEQAEKNPDDARLQFKLANAYHDGGYLHSALQHYKRSIEIDPNSSKGWVNMGVVQKELNRRDDSIASFERAIEIDASDPLAHVNLGDEYLWKKLYQAAVDEYRTALDLDGQCAPAYYSLAISFAESGMYRDAARAWRRCAEIALEDEGETSETYKRATENAKLMEDIVADAEKQIEERERVKKELEGKSD